MTKVTCFLTQVIIWHISGTGWLIRARPGEGARRRKY